LDFIVSDVQRPEDREALCCVGSILMHVWLFSDLTDRGLGGFGGEIV